MSLEYVLNVPEIDKLIIMDYYVNNLERITYYRLRNIKPIDESGFANIFLQLG